MLERLRSSLRLVVALALGACIVLFSGVWTVAVYWAPPEPVELGFDSTYSAFDQSLTVTLVRPNSPAERAGLRPGDRMMAIDGEHFESAETQSDAWRRHKPGDRAQLTIERPGVAGQVILRATFRAPSTGGMPDYVSASLGSFVGVAFVVVGLAVLFLRLEDPHAWLLALLFASFVTVPRIPTSYLGVPPMLRGFVRAYEAIFLGELGALFYFFFAVFPVRSPIDRRLPWLKWVGVAMGLAVALPGVGTGQLVVPPLPWALPHAVESQFPFVYELVFISLGFVSLVWNYVGSRDDDARRKLRLIVWGALVGVAPGVIYRVLQDLAGILPASAAAGTVLGLASALLPLSFAYAVLKHRVLEIPVLIRRSARYLLVQRGFTFLLSLVSIGLTLFLALTLGPYLQPRFALAAPTGIALGALLGTMLVWGGLSLHRRVSGQIDRAFFRATYDARVILEDLAERLRTADDRGDVALLLSRHVRDALQPTRLMVYIEDGSGALLTDSPDLAPTLRALDPTSSALASVTAHAQPLDVTASEEQALRKRVAPLAALGAECLVPIIGRGGRLTGLVALGPRRSEEPYAGEDRRLLASVAAQAAAALDNIRLAEEIATRLEEERRALREMEIASDVQRRLLPDAAPAMRSLTCAAQCIQTRSVGGDCYDYLEFGEGLVGLVLADVSGKGVHAALLMANLQAHLRSQSSATPNDPARVLREVNRLLWASTATQHYATLFFGLYDDGRRHLRYVNCGHMPPVLLRANDDVERLPPTAPAIGLFDQWECAVREVTLGSGDVLAIFSDGVTDAPAGDVEFGEARLIDELRSARDLEPAAIVDRVLSAVQEYSGGTQFDDLTLLVARCVEAASGTRQDDTG